VLSLNSQHIRLIAIVIFSALFCSSAILEANAQMSDFNLEAEQNWDTYTIGGTCVYGTQNIFVGDVNGDGVLEILTGGFAYNTSNGSRTGSEAPLKVWSWNGQNVTLKASTTWEGNILCLYAADADGDGTVEVITAGYYRNESDSHIASCLRIWSLNSQGLTLRAQYEGASVRSIFVNDVDKDGKPEIVTVGDLRKTSLNTGQLCVWRFEGNTLSLAARLELDSANVTKAYSVCASDLDKDGKVEIVVGGYSGNLNDSRGQLSIWQWNGNDFSLRANEIWQLVPGVCAKTIAGAVQGNTVVNSVKAADLDGDGLNEIVSGGFAFDGERVDAQLGIWSWDGMVLTPLQSQEWATDYLTEVKAVSIGDVDNDGRIEVVTSGMTAAENSFKNSDVPHDRGQLRVWGLDGTGLILEQKVEWTFDDGACAWNVGSGDVDEDGVLEIVTVGCTALGSLCDPDMRIWSISGVGSNPISFVLGFAAALIIIAVILLGVFVFVWQRNKK
jgi:hypothetical protein